MSKMERPTDSDMRHLMLTIDNGILLAQKRLVQRAIREDFTLIACPDGTHVIEIDPRSVVF